MKKKENLIYRLGRSFTWGIKSFVRGMPEKKVYARPTRRKYLHRQKDNLKQGTFRHNRPRITRKEIDKYALLKEKQRIGER